MASEVKVPRLAESISEAVLVAWLKQDGESVRADEPIATLETDKAAVEIPADRAGVLRHARKVGDTVVVGDVLARIDDGAGSAAGDQPTQKPAEPPEPKPAASQPSAPAATARPAAPESRRPEPAESESESDGEAPYGPAVRRMIAEHGLDPDAIPASGRGGRLLKEDVQRYLEGAPAGAASAPVAPKDAASGRGSSRSSPAPPASAPVAPPPAAAPPSRVPVPAAAPTAATAPRLPADWAEGEAERSVPMSRIRQRIAERLVQAQQTAAILTTFNEVDMGAVMELRARYREGFEQRHGVKLSYMSFFARACIVALQQIPEINAEIRGKDIIYHRHVHLGIAVGTDRGLVVPVVHGAGQRSFAEIEREIARLADRARAGKLSLDELSGGTFTISNGGVYGSLLSTPILNPPQSGILGMHKIQKRGVVMDDQLMIRPMMYLALSYDHRIVDGEQAVTFLVSVKERLEDPERLLLEV
ncbi:MAG TPA: 2-oxoglutarate dehydrogenase complex dihydrolipoyllysine-residue succinyltransferase [Candidatus Limnocylindria bacterium]|nr:2-oxoglutarate dehydrogenase complex dihydrolipoyllysine-residue succinyltransferase [Candidatus Limnocylindria bacterium]